MNKHNKTEADMDREQTGGSLEESEGMGEIGEED